MTTEKLQEIREIVQEAFDEKEDLNCNVIGLYNYIRYGNEDFEDDMIINNEKPITNNSELQHYYLVVFINECIKRGYKIPGKLLDYESDHYCPAYRKVIAADLCYDSLCCLTGLFKISSTKELAEITDIDEARKICKACPYSDLNVGVDECYRNLD